MRLSQLRDGTGGSLNSRSLRVLLASALGAGIGTLVAFSLGAWLWWIGLIVGGIVGYLSYDWRQIAMAIPRAYRHVRGWRPAPSLGKALWAETVTSACLLSWMACIGGALTICLYGASALFPDGEIERVVTAFLLFVRLPGLCIGLLAPSFVRAIRAILMGETRIQEKLSREMPAREEWDYFFAPFVLCRLACRLPGYSLATARLLGRFAWRLFVLVHSEARLICGVDAFIGAAIGYAAGSVPIGAAAGGVLGLVNYAVITRRWLIPAGHLVPAPAENKVD